MKAKACYSFNNDLRKENQAQIKLWSDTFAAIICNVIVLYCCIFKNML